MEEGLVLGIRDRQQSWNTEDPPGPGGGVCVGGCFGHQDIVRSPEGLEICLQGQKKKDYLGRCPDDFYHLPTSIFSLLWGGGGETFVWCLFAQGRVVRVWRDGRGWKALVASRFKAQKRMLLGTLPSLESSCRLGPGCAHRPVSASPQLHLPKKPRSCSRARTGVNWLGDYGGERR